MTSAPKKPVAKKESPKSQRPAQTATRSATLEEKSASLKEGNNGLRRRAKEGAEAKETSKIKEEPVKAKETSKIKEEPVKAKETSKIKEEPVKAKDAANVKEEADKAQETKETQEPMEAFLPKSNIVPKPKNLNKHDSVLTPNIAMESGGVKSESDVVVQPDASFAALPLDESLLQAIKNAGFEKPTVVQSLALPLTLIGKDVCAFAQTGTGKTAVISITSGAKLLALESNRGSEKSPAVLILVPTRELAVQVESDLSKLLAPLGIKSVALFGGADMEKQKQLLLASIDVVVATPGRLLDHYKNHNLNFDKVKFFVCDEADRMFDMGFVDDVEFVLRQLPEERVQKLMTSATGSEKVRELAFEYLEKPEYIESNPETITPEKIKQIAYAVPAIEKFQVLLGHMKTFKPKCAIVFTNTKVVAEWVAYKLACNGVSAEPLTGDLPQKTRMSLIKQIKEGKIEVLVATDVLSRGLHVSALTHVYNFDVPEEASSFVHRIGRTARAGAEGTAITLICEDYGYNMGAVEDLLAFKIPLRNVPKGFYNFEDVSDYPFDENGRVKSFSKLAKLATEAAEVSEVAEAAGVDNAPIEPMVSGFKEFVAQPVRPSGIVAKDNFVAAARQSASAAQLPQQPQPAQPLQASAVVGGRTSPGGIQPRASVQQSLGSMGKAQPPSVPNVGVNGVGSKIAVAESETVELEVAAKAQGVVNPRAPLDQRISVDTREARNETRNEQFGKRTEKDRIRVDKPREDKVRDERYRDDRARETVEEALEAARKAAERRRALAKDTKSSAAEVVLVQASERLGEALGFLQGRLNATLQRGLPLVNEIINSFREGYKRQADKANNK